MSTGYTRFDTQNNIDDSKIIYASSFDGEFDAIEEAMSTSGHTHDGTAGQGGPIENLGPNQDITIDATNFQPATTNTMNLGSSSRKFKDVFLDGIAYLDEVSFSSSGVFNITAGSDTDTEIFFEAPDVTSSSQVDVNFWRNTNASVELTLYKGNGTAQKQHTFFNNSVRLIRDGAGTMSVGHDDDVQFVNNTAPMIQVLAEGAKASMVVARFSDNSSPARVQIAKGRGGSISNSPSILQDGDEIGMVDFVGADGTDIQTIAAQIGVVVDGTPGTDQVPAEMNFRVADSGGSLQTVLTLRADGTIRMPNLPTSEPGTSNTVWASSGALMVT